MILFGALVLFAIDSPPANHRLPFDAVDVLVVKPTGRPLRVRLHITNDGQSFRQLWKSQLDALFETLDADRSGKLDEKERLGLPWTTESTGIDRDALVEMAAERSPPLEITSVPPAGKTATGLFVLLDANRDGMIDESELAQAPSLIERRDFDDNGLLTVDELVPPFRPGDVQGLAIVALNEIGELAAEDKVRFENRLSEKDIPKNIDFECWLPLGRSKLRLDATVPATAEAGSARTSVGRINLEAADVKIQLQILRSGLNSGMNTSSQYPAFTTVDVDKNGYIDATELKMAFPPDLFPLVDRDGDDRVFSEEYHGFIARRERVRKATLGLFVSDLGQELFDAIDADSNGVISKLELEKAANLPNKFHAESKRIDSGQFPHSLQWYLGVAGANRPSPAMQPSRPSSIAAAKAPDVPEWFHAMDLNHDGLVDRTEFLGNEKQFVERDKNKDRLLTPQECPSPPKDAKPQIVEKSKS